MGCARRSRPAGSCGAPDIPPSRLVGETAAVSRCRVAGWGWAMSSVLFTLSTLCVIGLTRPTKRVNTRMIDELRDGRAGTAVLPGDTDWGANPPIYPPPGDPVAVVRPETPEQVGEALRFAAAEGIGVGIRSGGHGGRPLRHRRRPGDRAVELHERRGRRHDGADRRRRALGRRRGRAREARARRSPRATPRASASAGSRSAAGSAGWCASTGLAFDSLIAAEVVLASGEVVTASADEHPDLFWALRGGGGNFGVVTTFVFEAHPLDGVVFGTLDLRRRRRRRRPEGLARRHARGARRSSTRRSW